ncbi:MAG: hypothetical protein VKO64_11115 [Candidatus Sericytochromatia bacterium]|nr:hypothetical protein [Candidatus Sericytochromatia bacterium]
MMRLWGTLVLAVAMAGCRVTPEATSLPVASGEAPLAASVPAALADLPVQGLPGKVVVSIQWPGLAARSTQVMPNSVQGVRVTIEKVAGQPLAAQWVKRGTTAVTTVALDVPAGDGYRVRAGAYTGWNEADPGTLLASGVAAQISVPWGKMARVTLEMAPVNAPRIVSVDLPAAGPGALLELGVAGAGDASAGVVVFPSGREVEVAIAAGSASVKVPQEAGVGPLRLRVDGILSVEGPVFRQLSALRILAADDPSNELPGPRNDPDDAAIHLWPGAGAPLTVAGTDVEGGDVPEVKGVTWSRPLPGPYSLSPAGRVACLSLGRGRVRAASGTLTTDRELELAPFEGPVVRVSDDADESNVGPRAVLLDAKRLLVLWRNGNASKVRWRILTLGDDGVVMREPVVRETLGAGLSEEKPVVAAVGSTMVLMLHRRGVTADVTPGKVRVSFAIRALDLISGELLASPSLHITPNTEFDSYRLGAVAAQGDNFEMVYSKWDGTKYANQWINLGVGPQPLGAVAINDQGAAPKAARGPMVDNPEVVALSDGGYMVLGTYEDGGSHILQFSTLSATGSALSSRSVAYSYDRPINQPSVAFDGTNFLVARYTEGTAGPSVEVARYNRDTLASLDVQANFVEAVNQPAWSPVTKPTSATYDSGIGRFLIGYTRAIPGVTPSGVTEGYQSVVRVIDPSTGKPEGSAYPMQTRSHSGTVVPGWAVYVRDGAVVARRLKLK